MTHLIKKQVIDCRISKSLDAFRVQHQLSQVYWSALLPAIEKAFDEVNNTDEVIVIDKLEIDLGQLTETHLTQKEWIIELQRTLTGELKANITAPSQQQQAGTRKQARIIHIGRQWLFFVQHGYLPWNAINITPQWHQEALEALAANFDCIQELRRLIHSNRRVMQRIIQQYDTPFLTGLLEVLTAKKNDSIHPLIEELYLVYQQVQPTDATIILLSKTAFRKTAMEKVIAAAAQQATGFSAEATALQLLKAMIKTQPAASALHAKLADQLPFLQPVWNKMVETLPAAPITPKPVAEEPAPPTNNETTIDPDLIKTTPTEKPFEEAIAPTVDKDGIFTELAGLVLLHPFLLSLFRQLEWVQDRSFVNKECQQRAILLLHFLATAETTTPPEYALVIPKVLCGYPLQEPLHIEPELTTSIIEEAEHLLEVIIQRWEVLKSTSIDGLREGFLLRKGLLQKVETGLRLRIKSSSIDMLLDQLPWGIGMIKLPWMKDLLKVEWR